MQEKALPLFKQATRTMRGIQIVAASGEVFNHVDTGGAMWTGDGDRSVTVTVPFDEAFGDAPMVTVGVSGMDADQGRNLRFDVRAQNVSAQKFDLVFVTWGDTLIARASVSWQAVGPVLRRPAPNRPLRKEAAE